MARVGYCFEDIVRESLPLLYDHNLWVHNTLLVFSFEAVFFTCVIIKCYQRIPNKHGEHNVLKIYLDNCCFNRPFDNQKNI
jgi:hypothetical protein